MQQPSLDALAGRSVLQLSDLSLGEIRTILDSAAAMKRDYDAWRGALAQRSAVLLFEKPSLRTRVSFEIGLAKLGAHAVYLDHQGSPIGERESVEDYGRNLERWADVLVARVHAHATCERLAACCKVPVICALSDIAHPCQILADALTLEEHGVRLDSMRLAFVGDGNNVCNSLMELAAISGGSIVVVTPKGYAPHAKVVARCGELAAISGGSIELSSDITAVRGADAVYTDAWLSMGQRDDGAKVAAMRSYQVNENVMRIAGPKALFMHCLPAHRGEEVTNDVIDGPNSVVFDQAENRMHAQNALVAHVLGASAERD
jgi:ornithine carbamoyltransferase